MCILTAWMQRISHLQSFYLLPLSCTVITVKRILLRCAVFLLATTILIGCGGKPVANVTGVVKYKGSPVPGGELILESTEKDGGTITTFLSEEGAYTLSDVPPGEYTVYFSNEMFNPKNKPTEYNDQNKMKAMSGSKKGPSPFPGMPPGMNPGGGSGKGTGAPPAGKTRDSTPEGAQRPGLKGSYVELPKHLNKNAGKGTQKITIPNGRGVLDIELKD